MNIVIGCTTLLALLACNEPGRDHQSNITKKMDSVTYSVADWIPNSNVYEVNLRQYSREGTFNEFARSLPRLKEMGVETLWFMPVTPIAEKNKKGSMGSYYACSDYTAINPEFGSMDDFKALVEKAHEMGFKVIIDWVANHTGWDHVWTKTHPEYFEKDSTGDFKIASGMEDIIELDFKNPDLRKAMIDAMRFWVTETGIDGYRCDLAFWVELDFWKEARTELEKTKKLFWLGELDILEHPEYMQVFDAAYTWTWMHKTKDYYEGKTSFQSLDSVLQQYDTALAGHAIKLWFTSNHDENSWNGTEYEKYGEIAQALAVFSFTWKGIPLIYSGQELPNKKRLLFFEKDTIEWTGKFELHDFYKTLLGLRKTNSALSTRDPHNITYRLATPRGSKLLAYLRKNEQNEVLVLLNLGKDPVEFIVDKNIIKGEYRAVFGDRSKKRFEEDPVMLKGWEYQVFEK